MSRKKLLPPGETLLHPITSAVEPIDLAGLFPVKQPLELELGCGDGSFTLQYALANPGRNIVALERLLGRITKLENAFGRLHNKKSTRKTYRNTCTQHQRQLYSNTPVRV